jgi:hypothetical protein
MKCFNHRELDAIAVCRHCGKAVCFECLAEVDGVAACKCRCEQSVANINDLTFRARSTYQKGSANSLKVAFFCGAMGVVMLGSGLLADRPNGSVPILFGVIFLIVAGLYVHSARRWKQRD